jgi:hypothetical protein
MCNKTINNDLKSKNQSEEENSGTEAEKWVAFSFIGRETRIVAKLKKVM